MRIYYNEQCIYFGTDAQKIIEKNNLNQAWTIRPQIDANMFDQFFLFIKSGLDNLIFEGDEKALFETFKKQFVELPAGGGVVRNETGDLLMIHRLGKWDLPKGKLDPGEDMASCAQREVEEETGLQEISLKGFLCSTWHIYKLKEVWILKQTDWYNMQAPNQNLIPQAEEDISQAIWVPQAEVESKLENSYPNIIYLLQS